MTEIETTEATVCCGGEADVTTPADVPAADTADETATGEAATPAPNATVNPATALGRCC